MMHVLGSGAVQSASSPLVIGLLQIAQIKNDAVVAEAALDGHAGYAAMKADSFLLAAA